MLTAALGAAALVGLRSVDAQAGALSTQWLKGVGDISEARARVLEAREMEVKHSRTDDTSYHAEYEEKMAESAKLTADLIERYKARGVGAESTELLATLDGGNVGLAAEIAAVPEHIRGYGHVKEAHLAKAKAREAELLAQWRGPAAKDAAAA